MTHNIFLVLYFQSKLLSSTILHSLENKNITYIIFITFVYTAYIPQKFTSVLFDGVLILINIV